MIVHQTFDCTNIPNTSRDDCSNQALRCIFDCRPRSTVSPTHCGHRQLLSLLSTLYPDLSRSPTPLENLKEMSIVFGFAQFR